MAAKISKFGPGTLHIGETASAIDVSCQIEYAQVAWEANKDDDIVVLCGDVVPGATTLTAKLSGHIFQDTGDPAGIVQASWGTLKGDTVPFKFVPNTVDDMQVTGSVVILPITVGSGEAGANMASDFEWDIVGEPTLTTVPEMPVKIDGADRFEATMNDAAAELGRLTDAHRETASLIVRAARPPRRTGRLASSIRVVPDPSTAVVEAGAPYAGAVHAGVPSRGIRPQPFLTRAVQDVQSTALDVYGRAVQMVLDDVKGD